MCAEVLEIIGRSPCHRRHAGTDHIDRSVISGLSRIYVPYDEEVFATFVTKHWHGVSSLVMLLVVVGNHRSFGRYWYPSVDVAAMKAGAGNERDSDAVPDFGDFQRNHVVRAFRDFASKHSTCKTSATRIGVQAFLIDGDQPLEGVARVCQEL